ncbi:hypothetical protein [Streptomyces fagopyri]|uniref:hypothetical protein n=1 Tax=Streptomyces fagopyri TaxID=2662397 RepID=UPI00371BBE26
MPHGTAGRSRERVSGGRCRKFTDEAPADVLRTSTTGLVTAEAEAGPARHVTATADGTPVGGVAER